MPADWRSSGDKPVTPEDLCLFYAERTREEAENFFKDLDKVSSAFAEVKVAKNKEKREAKEKQRNGTKEKADESSSNKV